MALTDAQRAQDEADYAAAFDEDMKPAAEAEPAQAAPAAQGPAEQTPMERAGDAGEAAAAGDEPRAEPSLEVAGEPDNTADAEVAAAAAGQAAGADSDIEKERQRLKSWEGRLKAMERQMQAGSTSAGEGAAATEEAPGEGSEKLDEVADSAAADGNGELAAAAEELGDAVESGEMTAEQAMKALAEDFGEDFVKMISIIARGEAGRAAGDVAKGAVADGLKDLGGRVDEIIGHIQDSATRAHFEAIQDAHPDFDEIGKSQGFKDYIEALGDKSAEAKKIIASGSARQINKLLSSYKASAKTEPTEGADKPAEQPVVEQAALDAAEGVRSGGMALPQQPARAAQDDYAAAWDQA